ncbi:unnamed protein product [Gongylonema pulchrum]|uniref:Secreted protein n=1 Tax=Gongylonema pulchrum TaxID=637853 RepID=A0A183EZD3_9BILA|nr:unnamed protein product [Gongylonema pulchrum]
MKQKLFSGLTVSIVLLDELQCRLQTIARSVAPMHSAPPFAGAGLLQLRVLIVIPILPAISAQLQALHDTDAQADHCPSILCNSSLS